MQQIICRYTKEGPAKWISHLDLIRALERALRRADLPGPHPPRIGVNTGFVYAANVGSRARREYTVMGDQVNLAGRSHFLVVQHNTCRVQRRIGLRISRRGRADERGGQ